jgi:hypothetical protein
MTDFLVLCCELVRDSETVRLTTDSEWVTDSLTGMVTAAALVLLVLSSGVDSLITMSTVDDVSVKVLLLLVDSSTVIDCRSIETWMISR